VKNTCNIPSTNHVDWRWEICFSSIVQWLW